MKKNRQSLKKLVGAMSCVLCLAGCGQQEVIGPNTDPPPPPPQDPPPQPPPAPVYKTITIPGGILTNLCPTWTQGDREFAGHGPKVDLEAKLSPTYAGEVQQRINIKVHFRATETQADWTGASGDWEFHLFDVPIGWVVDKFLDPYWFAAYPLYTDTNLAPDCFSYPNDFITHVCTMGDTRDDDVGGCGPDYAGVLSLSYRPVRVQLRSR